MRSRLSGPPCRLLPVNSRSHPKPTPVGPLGGNSRQVLLRCREKQGGPREKAWGPMQPDRQLPTLPPTNRAVSGSLPFFPQSLPWGAPQTPPHAAQGLTAEWLASTGGTKKESAPRIPKQSYCYTRKCMLHLRLQLTTNTIARSIKRHQVIHF